MGDIEIKEFGAVFSDIDNLEAFLIEDSIEENKDLSAVGNLPKDPTVEAAEDFVSLLGSMDFADILINDETIQDDDDFIRRQHEILGIDYMVIDIKGTVLKVVTNHGKSFLIDMEKLNPKIYGVIFTTYMPRKLCFNSKQVYSANNLKKISLYDIQHIVKMFYGKDTRDIKELVSMFCKNPSDNENALLYNLFHIKDALNRVLDKNRYMSLINKEFKALEAISRAEHSGIPFSLEKYTLFKNRIEDEYAAALRTNSISLGIELKDTIDSREAFLMALQNKNIPASYNEEFWKATDNTELQGLLLAHKLVKKHTLSNLNYTDDRLYITYNSYNNFSNVEPSFELDNFYIESEKNIVTGSYVDLYYRIFANQSKIGYVIEAVNNNSLIKSLSERIFGTTSSIARFNTSFLLRGYIEGNFEPLEMCEYYFKELDSFLSPEEVSGLMKSFETKCPEILTFIKKFKKNRSKDKRFINSSEIYPLHAYIRLTEADIFKSALTEIDEVLSSFNENNKYKINIVGIQKDKIILESDDIPLNVAIDLLNRKLTSVFDIYIDKVQVLFNVTSSNKLK